METLVRSSIISAIAFVIFSFLIVSSSFAASALLTTISGISFTEGTTEFTITDSTPTFAGTTVAGGPVDITIDGSTENILADDSGGWTYTPSSALSDTVEIFIADVNEFITFSLTISAASPSETSTSTGSSSSGSAGTLPSAGAPNPIVVFTLGGLLLAIIGTTGFKISSKN